MKTIRSNFTYISLLLCFILVAGLVLAACSRGNDSAAPTSAPAPTNTALPVPTNTSKPAPTNTARPVPTNTAAPAPTNPPAATANPIQNILWLWTSFKNQSTGETKTIPNPDNYAISFFQDGTLTGKADCNTFTGTYSQQNGFSIKLGAMTQAYCGDASLDQQYIQLLNAVAAGGPDGQGNLALETAGGEQRMLFKNGGPATK